MPGERTGWRCVGLECEAPVVVLDLRDGDLESRGATCLECRCPAEWRGRSYGASPVRSEQLYRWPWRARLPVRHGMLFRVRARGALNSCLVEFVADGFRAVTSRNALRKVGATYREEADGGRDRD